MSNTVQSRRRPYPWDAYIKDVRVILVPQSDGNLVGIKSKTLEATAPVTYDYGSASPYKERTALFRELYGGLGLAVEPNQGSLRRYSYTEKADLSINGKWKKGPKFETHIETINAAAGAVRQLILGNHNNTEVLFAICQNGVYRRTADNTWVASLTSGTAPALPGGQIPQQAVRYKGDYGGAPDALYLGTDDGNIWEYNGPTQTWSQAAAAEGPGIPAGNGECRFVEKIREEFWAAGDYWVVRNIDGANPMLRASYAGVIFVGDQTSKISWLKAVGNQLIIFKSDGRIFTINADGEADELFYFPNAVTATNGRNAASWLGKIWAPVGESLVRLDEGFNLAPDGLDALLDNTSDIRGKYVAGAGHHIWFFYEIYYNEITNHSYLIKHGSWVGDPESAITTGSSHYVDVHHGAIYDWSKQATACEVIQGIHSSSNDRLYVGFSDATVEWCVLPRTSPDPSKDSSCEFTGGTSYIYLPKHHARFQADNKLWQGISVFADHLSPSEYAQVQYRIFDDPTADWEILTDDGVTNYTLSGQRLDFPIDPPLYSKFIQLRVQLIKNANLSESPANISPILDGIGVHESVRPTLALEYTMNILCSSFVPKHDGTVDRRRGSVVRRNLLNVASEVGNITVTMPSGDVEEVAVVDYRENYAAYENRRDEQSIVTMTFIQVRTATEPLESPGITYGFLEDYTLGELEDII